jgi:hypothetical protein
MGIAYDLDAIDGKVYYSRNGVWEAGADPGMGTGGATLELFTYEPITPAANISKGDSITANFGALPFQYPVPAGFEAGVR